jgi:hypothetical protein
VLDRIDAKAVHIGFPDPVAVGLDEGIDDFVLQRTSG